MIGLKINPKEREPSRVFRGMNKLHAFRSSGDFDYAVNQRTRTGGR